MLDFDVKCLKKDCKLENFVRHSKTSFLHSTHIRFHNIKKDAKNSLPSIIPEKISNENNFTSHQSQRGELAAHAACKPRHFRLALIFRVSLYYLRNRPQGRHQHAPLYRRRQHRRRKSNSS